MSTWRCTGIAALLASAGLAMTGCGASAHGADPALPEVASVSSAGGDAPGVITLAEAAEQRLGLQVTPVTAGPSGLVVPYGAVVYEPDGSAWVFVRTAAHTYQRAPVEIDGIGDGRAALSSGPPAGTPVVSQAAAELVGVENGISGEQ